MSAQISPSYHSPLEHSPDAIVNYQSVDANRGIIALVIFKALLDIKTFDKNGREAFLYLISPDFVKHCELIDFDAEMILNQHLIYKPCFMKHFFFERRSGFLENIKTLSSAAEIFGRDIEAINRVVFKGRKSQGSLEDQLNAQFNLVDDDQFSVADDDKDEDEEMHSNDPDDDRLVDILEEE